MAWSKVERIAELSRMVGLTIAREELREVGDRLDTLVRELDSLATIDLADIEPVTVFPEENDVGDDLGN